MPERGLNEKIPVLAAGSLSGLPSRLGVSCKTRVISEEKGYHFGGKKPPNSS